jgi:hypothetical protein
MRAFNTTVGFPVAAGKDWRLPVCAEPLISSQIHFKSYWLQHETFGIHPSLPAARTYVERANAVKTTIQTANRSTTTRPSGEDLSGLQAFTAFQMGWQEQKLTPPFNWEIDFTKFMDIFPQESGLLSNS